MTNLPLRPESREKRGMNMRGECVNGRPKSVPAYRAAPSRPPWRCGPPCPPPTPQSPSTPVAAAGTPGTRVRNCGGRNTTGEFRKTNTPVNKQTNKQQPAGNVALCLRPFLASNRLQTGQHATAGAELVTLKRINNFKHFGD